MANFQPLKDRFIKVLEENLRVFQIGGVFFDYGCGRGDVAEHLICNPVFTQGYAYDLAVTEEQIQSGGVRAGGGHLTYLRRTDELPDKADLAVLLDVIEHVHDPERVFHEIADHVRKDGWLILTMPYNPHEWGIDDEFYGHLRRLSLRGSISLLENSGWNVIRLLDPTFPSFWFIRRGYLLLRALTSSSVQQQPAKHMGDIEKTLKSARDSAWDYGGIIPRLLANSLVPWMLVRRFDIYFESFFRGFELFVVCQKRSTSRDCSVCLNGHFTFQSFFHRYNLQKCTFCATEKVLPRVEGDLLPRDTDHLRSRLARRFLTATQNSRLRNLLGLPVKEKTIIVISRGAQALQTQVVPADWHLTQCHGNDLLNQNRMLRFHPDGARYGVVAMIHLIELFEEVSDAIRILDDMVAPGGYAYLEFPNSRSILKKVLRWRWFGYDPPMHRYVLDPLSLADQLGMRNYRLIRESHFAPEYSFYIFAQIIINTVFPFQRDALFDWLLNKETSGIKGIMTLLSLLLMPLLLPLFLMYQPLASLLRRGCVTCQLYRKTDVPNPHASGILSTGRD
ncbi:MAG: methyltransferase domain-containing protein [Proteobacteria bacterium]|nr:methyltransferase domain-containing protein [Pseudomonadota bacterium]